jgi:hypothetical protein
MLSLSQLITDMLYHMVGDDDIEARITKWQSSPSH